MAENTNTEREALLELIDAYAEARHVGGCHTYNAKTAKARAEVIAALDAAESPYAPCYVCGRPMDGLSEDDCHCFHRKELRASLPAAGQEPVALEPERSAWINPCDKSQGQYLPHIGEPVLFKHEGRVYTGKHTGGSFKSDFPLGKHFDTWNCVWAYPSALDSAAPQPAVAAGWPLIARALDEWREDDGPVMWWAWNGHASGWAGEPAWCGTPLSSDWPGYHTHWTPHPTFPPAPSTEVESDG